jgi:hypothetical protein
VRAFIVAIWKCYVLDRFPSTILEVISLILSRWIIDLPRELFVKLEEEITRYFSIALLQKDSTASDQARRPLKFLTLFLADKQRF